MQYSRDILVLVDVGSEAQNEGRFRKPWFVEPVARSGQVRTSSLPWLRNPSASIVRRARAFADNDVNPWLSTIQRQLRMLLSESSVASSEMLSSLLLLLHGFLSSSSSSSSSPSSSPRFEKEDTELVQFP